MEPILHMPLRVILRRISPGILLHIIVLASGELQLVVSVVAPEGEDSARHMDRREEGLLLGHGSSCSHSFEVKVKAGA